MKKKFFSSPRSLLLPSGVFIGDFVRNGKFQTKMGIARDAYFLAGQPFDFGLQRNLCWRGYVGRRSDLGEEKNFFFIAETGRSGGFKFFRNGPI